MKRLLLVGIPVGAVSDNIVNTGNDTTGTTGTGNTGTNNGTNTTTGADTAGTNDDGGMEIKETIHQLEVLLQAYRDGTIIEK